MSALNISLNMPRFDGEYDEHKMRVLVEEIERLHRALTSDDDGTGGVDSVFGRVGDIVALTTDYDEFYPEIANNETILGDWTFSGLLTVPEATVTTHEAALTILESQIPNGSILARVASDETILGNWSFTGLLTIPEQSVLDHEAAIDHDALTNFVAEEHIRWDLTGVEDVHVDRITSAAITQHEGDIDHDALTNFVAAEHIDWSATGIEDIHVDRITQASVTQHEGALTITEAQISDLDHYTNTDANAAIDARVTQAFVAALSFYTESEIDGFGFLTSVQAADVDSEASTDGHVLTSDGAGNAVWEAPSGGGVTDHGALTGLSDNDHPQYARLAVDETVTGRWEYDAGIGINRASIPSNWPLVVAGAGQEGSILLENTAIADGDRPFGWVRMGAANLEIGNSLRSGTSTSSSVTRISIDPTGAVDIIGALTAASYGGITESNLLDKSAAETITGQWTFDLSANDNNRIFGGGSNSENFAIIFGSSYDNALAPIIRGFGASSASTPGDLTYSTPEGGDHIFNSTSTGGDVVFESTINNISASATDADFDNITATSYGGITESNLLDKNASETITGEYTFNGSVAIGAGVFYYSSVQGAANLSDGWVRVASCGSANGRGAARIYVSHTGGTGAPDAMILDVSQSWSSTPSVNVLSNPSGSGIDRIRVGITAGGEAIVEIEPSQATDVSWEIHVQGTRLSDTWVADFDVAGTAPSSSYIIDVSTQKVMWGSFHSPGNPTVSLLAGAGFVVGDFDSTESILEIRTDSTGVNSIIKYREGDDDFGANLFYDGSSNDLRLTMVDSGVFRNVFSAQRTTGDIQFHADILNSDGSAASPSYSFSSDPDTGMYRFSANNLMFVAGGNNNLRVRTSDVLVDAGYLFIFEKAAASADISGWGQLWVHNDTPNTLWFTDDAGGDQLIDPSVSQINTQNGNYTLVLADKGKTIRKASGGAGETITIPSNASVAYPIGTLICFQNDGGGDLTIAITSDTLTGTDGSTGSRTLGDDQTAVIQKVTSTSWKYAASDL